jgi:acyl-coenzyme A synthetase/AMP-(fatty) acid ligase
MSPTTLSTSDHIRLHAQHRPGAIALIDGARQIDYATFHRDLGRFTRALLELKPPPRGLVAVTCECGFYVHWLLVLACENLGLPSVSYLKREGVSLLPLLRHAMLVLCGSAPPQEGTARRHVLTKEWLASAFSQPDEAPAADTGYAPLGLNEPHRVRRSSGTTGVPKLMMATRGYEAQRLHVHQTGAGFNADSRFLVTMPFTVGVMHSVATACLRLGGTCIASGSDLAQEFVRHRFTHARLFQFQIEALLDALPASFRKPADFTVILSSAHISEPLWQKLLDRLASRIVYTYSLQEAGTISDVARDGAGTLLPGVEVDVVDERGVPLPDGQAGQIRVKSVEMVSGYLDDPEGTAKAFRDGWFYSGDAGVMDGPRRLRLVGRVDDMLNIGGLKFAPGAIEDALARELLHEEFAVTSRPGADGVDELCVAVVTSGRMKTREDAERIGKCVPKSFGKVQVAFVTGIPRTAETGKVQRARLQAMVAGK